MHDWQPMIGTSSQIMSGLSCDRHMGPSQDQTQQLRLPPAEQQQPNGSSSSSSVPMDSAPGVAVTSTITCSYSNAAEAAALAAARVLCSPSATWADKEAQLPQLLAVQRQHLAEATEALLCAGAPQVLDACLAIIASSRTSALPKLQAADLVSALCCSGKCSLLVAPSSITERLLRFRAQEGSVGIISRDAAARVLWQLACHVDFQTEVISQAGGHGSVIHLLAADLHSSSTACIAAVQAVLSLAATASGPSAYGTLSSTRGCSGSGNNGMSVSTTCASGSCTIDDTVCESMGAVLLRPLTLLLDATQPETAALAAEAVALLSGCALNRSRLVAAGGLAALAALLQGGNEACCAAALAAVLKLVGADPGVVTPALLAGMVPAALRMLGTRQCTELALGLLADLAALPHGRQALLAAHGLEHLAAFVEARPEHQQAVVLILSQATCQQQQQQGCGISREASAELLSSEQLLRSLVSCLAAAGHGPKQHAVQVLIWALQQAKQQQWQCQQQRQVHTTPLQGSNVSAGVASLLQLQRRLLNLGCLPQLSLLLCDAHISDTLKQQALELLLLLSTCPELLHAAAMAPCQTVQSYSLIIDVGAADNAGGFVAAQTPSGLDACVPGLLAMLESLLQQRQQQQHQEHMLMVQPSAPPLPQHEQQQQQQQHHQHSLTSVPSAQAPQLPHAQHPGMERVQQQQQQQQHSWHTMVLDVMATICFNCNTETARKLMGLLVKQHWVQVLWQFLPHDQQRLDALYTSQQACGTWVQNAGSSMVHNALEVLAFICTCPEGVEQLLALHRRCQATATASRRRSSSSNGRNTIAEVNADAASNSRGAPGSSSASSSSSSSPSISSPISHSRFLALLGGRQHSFKASKTDSSQRRDQASTKGSSTSSSSKDGSVAKSSGTPAGAEAAASLTQLATGTAAEPASGCAGADLDSICIVGCSPPAEVHAMFRTLSTPHSLDGAATASDAAHTAVVAMAEASVAAGAAADAADGVAQVPHSAAGALPAAATPAMAAAAPQMARAASAAALHVDLSASAAVPAAAPANAQSVVQCTVAQWSVVRALVALLPLPWATEPASRLLAHLARADASAADCMLQEGLAQVLAGCLAVCTDVQQSGSSGGAVVTGSSSAGRGEGVSSGRAGLEAGSSSSSSSSSSTLALLKLVQVLAASYARDLQAAGVVSHVLQLLKAQGPGADLGSAGPVVLEALAAVEQLACARERVINAAIAQCALLQLASALAVGVMASHMHGCAPQGAGSSCSNGSGSSSGGGGGGSSSTASGMAASALHALLDTGAVDHVVAETLDAGAVAKLLGSCVLCLPLPAEDAQGEEEQPRAVHSSPTGSSGSRAGTPPSQPVLPVPFSSSSHSTLAVLQSSSYVSLHEQIAATALLPASAGSTSAAAASSSAAAATDPAAGTTAAAGAPQPAAPAAEAAAHAAFVATRIINALIPLHARFSDALVKIQGIPRLVSLVGGTMTPLQLRLEALAALDHLALRHRDELVASRAVPAVVGVLRLQPRMEAESAAAVGADRAPANAAADGIGAAALDHAVANPLVGMRGLAASRPANRSAIGITLSPALPVTPEEAEAQLLLGSKIRACNLITVLAFNNDVKRQLFHAEAVGPLMALAQCQPALPALRGALSQLGLVYLLPPQ